MFVIDEKTRPIGVSSREIVTFVALVSPVVAVVVLKHSLRVPFDSTSENIWAGLILVRCICFVLFKLVNATSSLLFDTEVISSSVPFISPVVFDVVVDRTSVVLMYSFSDVNPATISSEEA